MSFAAELADTQNEFPTTDVRDATSVLPDDAITKLAHAAQKSACVACRRRKIKCDKLYPCTACSQSEIQCGFINSHRTKSRAKVLQKLRRLPVEEQIEMSRQSFVLGSPSCGLDLKLMTPLLVFRCTEAFFERCYPINIVLGQRQLDELTNEYQENPKQYSLLASLCAVAIYQCEDRALFETDQGRTSAVTLSSRLLEAAVRARALYDYVGQPDFEFVLISFNLSIATFQQQQDTKGWYYLREACTILQTCGLHKEATYKDPEVRFSGTQVYQRRLLYYLISISERANSIHRDLPVTLDHTIAFPLMNMSDPVHRGFVFLNELFAPFDREYTSYRDCGSLPFRDPNQYVLDLHRKVVEACPPYSFFASFHKPFPEAAVADLLVTKQWLLIKVYHLALQHNLLTYLPPESDLGLLYPIRVARDLLEVINMIDQSGGEPFEVHGTSMLEKFYDIATTLADLVQVVPIPPSLDAALPASGSLYGCGPQDLLHALVQLVSQLRREHNIYLPRLVEKVHECVASERSKRPEAVHRQHFYSTVNLHFEDLFEMFGSGASTGHNSDG